MTTNEEIADALRWALDQADRADTAEAQLAKTLQRDKTRTAP